MVNVKVQLIPLLNSKETTYLYNSRNPKTYTERLGILL